METIENIIKRKIPTVSLSDSVDSAIKKMQKYKIKGFPVMKSNKVVGMIASKELSYHHPNRLIQDAMRKELTMVLPQMAPLEVLLLMKRKNTSQLPVVDSDHCLLGVITKEDILYNLNGKDFSLVRQLVEEVEDKTLNPLQVIQSATGLLKKIKNQSSIREYTKMIDSSIKRIKDTVRSLRREI